MSDDTDLNYELMEKFMKPIRKNSIDLYFDVQHMDIKPKHMSKSIIIRRKEK